MIKLNKRYIHPLLMGMSIVVVILFIHTSNNVAIVNLHERLEGLIYDMRMRFFIPDEVQKDPRILIVDIDDASLQTVGRWPWPRAELAKLIKKTADMAPAVIGLDIMFPEPELSPLDVLASASVDKTLINTVSDEVKRINESLDGDRLLAQAFMSSSSVLGYTLAKDDKSSSGQLPESAVQLSEQEKSQLRLPVMPGYLANIPVLQSAASGAGFFAIEPDDDGIIRWSKMLLEREGNVYPSLSLAIMQQYMGLPPIELLTADAGDKTILEAISLSGILTVPTDEQARVLVPFVGPALSFTYISAYDILMDVVDPALFADAIVLVGSTAKGLHDLRATPVGSIYPGVEVHANLLLGMLNEKFPDVADWAAGVNILMIVVVGSLLAFVMPSLKPHWLILLTISVISAYMIVSFWLWHEKQIVLSQALPLMMLSFLGLTNAAYGFLRVSKDRGRLQSIFSQYVPPQIVDEMSKSPETSFGFEGESREMTVLFADIRTFTTISESLQADELKRMLNYFFTPMTGIIFNNRGTIDKYVGDMIMAFWGAPLNDPDHARHALISAVSMLKRVHEMQDELAARGWPEIKIGVGLSSGMMNVGDMGSEYRRSYTVIGDAVNYGARLEDLTKFYDVDLCVSESTKDSVPDYAFRLLDKVQVKGKNEATTIYEPIGPLAELSDIEKQELIQHKEALNFYFAGDWQAALSAFNALENSFPDRKLYALYGERIKALQQQVIQLPWDGVFTHTTK